MKSFFKLRESTARERWNKAAEERQKKHDEIEAKRVAAAKQGKENMSGAIEKLSHVLYKEETELEEAKIGDKVQVIGGSQKGLVGHVGEIRKGLGGTNHTYTVDYDDNGKRSSVQVKKAHTKVIKEVRSEYSKGAHDDDAQAFSGKAPYDYSKEPVTRTRISSSKDRSGKETHEVRQTHGKTYEVIASTHNTRQDAERAQAALRKKHGLSEETIQQMIEELQKQVND